MKRSSRRWHAPGASGLVVVALAFSACAVRDVPADAESCDYRCTWVCPPGFRCRDGYCVRPSFTSTCTPDEEGRGPVENACRSDDGLLTLSSVPSVQACTGQEVAVSLEVTGGEGPFEWFSSSHVPDVVLEQDAPRHALLRGTLNVTGSFEVGVGVRDARNCVEFRLPVEVAQTPAITAALPAVCAGAPVQIQLTAEGGDSASYRWSYESTAPLEQDGATLYGNAPSTPGEYPVRLTLRDARCPIEGAAPVTLDTRWTVRSIDECPSIDTPVLPAPCEGLLYSQPLVASGGAGTGYVWTTLSDQLPSGLAFDAERGVIEGTPTGVRRSGSLEVSVADAMGQRAVATLDLSLRSDCRIAWIGDEPPRLHVGDVFLSIGEIVLPQDAAADVRVLDMEFSPDGAWLAFRAGVAGGERLHLYPIASPAADARRVDFVCPDAAACAVLDYAWSRDSRHLAVVSSDGSSRDFVSGLSFSEPGTFEPWPVVERVLVGGVEVPLDYVRDLSWAVAERWGFVGASGQEATPETVFVAEAGLAAAPLAMPYYDYDLRLRPTPAGWVAFDAFYYTTTALVPPDGVALHAVAWTSPTGEHAASIFDGQLSIYAMSDALAPLATTEPGSCPVVAAWAPRANGVERIICSGGTLDAPDGNALRVFDFDVARAVFVSPSGKAIPLNGTYVPTPLTNARRLFSASADWLALNTPGQGGVLQPVPMGSEALPRSTQLISMSPQAELSFAPNGRHLVVYDESGLRSVGMAPAPDRSNLSWAGSSGSLPPPRLASCEEAIWTSPESWCGAPAAKAHFVISRDSKGVLFEADDGLWIADLGMSYDRPPRRVAQSFASAACGSNCVGVSYAFAP